MSNASQNTMHSILNTISTSTDFEALFEAALAKFTKCTGKDLRNHPIATLIDGCTSPDAILAIFQEQYLAFKNSGTATLNRWDVSDPLWMGCTPSRPMQPSVLAPVLVSPHSATSSLLLTHFVVYLRHLPLRILFFLQLASSSPCVSLSHFPVPTSPVIMFASARWPST
jgi:hypothetical protein